MRTLDIGAPRTLSDHLAFEGVPNPAVVAAASTWVKRYDLMVERQLMSLPPAAYITRQEMIDFVADNPQIVESVAFAVDHKKRIPAIPSARARVKTVLTLREVIDLSRQFIS